MKLALTSGGAAQQLDLSDYEDTGRAGQTLVLQNLGPADVFFDRFEGVTSNTGVKVAAGGDYELAIDGGALMYFKATGNADLRYTVVG